MTDQEHATKIKECAQALQSALNEAANAGLQVSVDVESFSSSGIDTMSPVPTGWRVSTEIARPL